MKKHILFVVFALVCFVEALGQTVEKSEKFVQIFGTKYYLHTMKTGETLEAIAGAYNTTIQEIKMNNQGVSNFQAGVLLRIPVIASNATESTTQQFAYHVVEKKQTLYSICKKYGVSQEDVFKYNPHAKMGLRSGETLKIPVGGKTEPDRQDIDFIYHTVKQNESFNSISQLYGVEISDIVKYNPSAKYSMKPGDIIRLPKLSSLSSVNGHDNQESSPVEGILETSDQVRKKAMQNSDYCPCENYMYSTSKTIKLALILPLFLKENLLYSEAFKGDPNKKSLKKNTEKIYEFYEGFLLAVKDYQSINKNIQLNVYDTEKSTSKIDEILSNPELKKMDLIIGPLYTENVIKAAKFASENQISLVSPFAVRNDLLKNNPYLFQFTPSTATSIEETTNYFGNLENASVIVVHDGKPSELEQLKIYRENLTKSFAEKDGVPELVFKEVEFASGGLNRITEAMSPSKTNVILMPGTDEIFISKVINHLTNLQKTLKYKIVLFGTQSWEQYSNIDIEFLQSMNFSFRSPSFIDYTDDKVKNFVSRFRDYYNTEPGIYGFSGYDIAKYFIGELEKHGKYFQFCAEKAPAQKGLVYKFDFKRVNPCGGFENRSNFVLRYGEDFTLKSVY